jgi:serine/threonine protein kinase
MNFLDPEYKSLTSEQLSLIDQICGDFEKRRMDGEETRIEDLVAASPACVHGVLELELVRIELEIAASWHELPSLAEFLSRFPGSAQTIKAEWKNWTGNNSEARSFDLDAQRRETQDAQNQPTPEPGEHASTSNQCAVSPAPAVAGQRFRILRRIAEGGIGTVYAAFDQDLQREVALKELKGSLVHKSAVINRFLVEATITSHLEHPNIVPIYATGRQSDGRHFYAMRFIRGQSMQSAIGNLHRRASKTASRDLNFRRDPEARDLLLRFITVCRAIAFAHSRGVIHRDLKPANVMVGDFGETLVVDWGLARRKTSQQTADSSPAPMGVAASPSQRIDVSQLTREIASSSASGESNFSQHDATLITEAEDEAGINNGATREGTIVGTPGYMSPEQAAGQVESVNETSDVYSLGATLFCLLTNAVPIEHTGLPFHPAARTNGPTKESPADAAMEATVISVANQDGPRMITSPRRIIASIPLALDAICRKAMASEQAERYLNTEDMARDLEAWLADEPVSVLPESRLLKSRRWLRQRPLLAGGFAGSVAIALVAMAVTLQILSGKNKALTVANDREQQATQNAKQQAEIAAANAKDADQQRQKIQEILHAFITDVERGLANVPGSAVVRKRVLTQVLNQLGNVSDTLRGNPAASLSSAMALTDLGDLFAQFGPDDVNGSIRFGDLESASPSDAAARLYSEAMIVVERRLMEDPDDLTTILEKSNIRYKQASLLRQTGKTAEATELISIVREDSRKIPIQQNPKSLEWAMAAAVASGHDWADSSSERRTVIRQSHSFWTRRETTAAVPVISRARTKICFAASASSHRDWETSPRNAATSRKQSRTMPRTRDIQNSLPKTNPDNLTAQRDYCAAIDRLGNVSADRGQLQAALESYLKSRKIREEILQSDPADQTSLREMFVSIMKCGGARMTLTLVSEAKSDFVLAGETADKMASMDAKSTVARRFQSFSAEMLADIALAEDDLDNALKYACAVASSQSSNWRRLIRSDGQARAGRTAVSCQSREGASGERTTTRRRSSSSVWPKRSPTGSISRIRRSTRPRTSFMCARKLRKLA